MEKGNIYEAAGTGITTVQRLFFVSGINKKT
jgi:hypothetical protein